MSDGRGASEREVLLLRRQRRSGESKLSISKTRSICTGHLVSVCSRFILWEQILYFERKNIVDGHYLQINNDVAKTGGQGRRGEVVVGRKGLEARGWKHTQRQLIAVAIVTSTIGGCPVKRPNSLVASEAALSPLICTQRWQRMNQSA